MHGRINQPAEYKYISIYMYIVIHTYVHMYVHTYQFSQSLALRTLRKLSLSEWPLLIGHHQYQWLTVRWLWRSTYIHTYIHATNLFNNIYRSLQIYTCVHNTYVHTYIQQIKCIHQYMYVCDQACGNQPLYQVIFSLISLAAIVVFYFCQWQNKAH